jgi:hypothetical protein
MMAIDKARLLFGTSEYWGNIFRKRWIEIDFLYIDGHHNYSSVLLDLQLWYPLLKNGGLLFCHDMDKRGPTKAVKEYFGRFLKYQNNFGPIVGTVPTQWEIKNE